VDPGYFTVHGLTRAQVFGGNYDGVPHLKLRIHLHANAHGAAQCTDGTLLITTTEAFGETTPPGELNVNYHESVLVICTLDDLLNGTMTGLPTWTLPGTHGTYANYDTALIPGTKTVIFENNNGFSIIDFTAPPGAIDTAAVKRAIGSNFGVGSPADLYGHLALGPDLRLYKQRASSSDIAWWNMSTLEALTSTPTNPPPDGVLTSPVFDALQDGVEHLFCCIDFDSQGRLYTASQRSSNYSNPVYESATLWRFSAAAALAGGAQEPECTLTLPSYSQPWMLRCAPGYRLHPR
jgi:hypothetical protein